MFPPRCIQPPWRNIEVSSVDQNGTGIRGAMSRPTEYSRGTTPQAVTNACSAPSGRAISRKNTATFRPTSAQVTIGGPAPLSPSSPIGSMPLA